LTNATKEILAFISGGRNWAKGQYAHIAACPSFCCRGALTERFKFDEGRDVATKQDLTNRSDRAFDRPRGTPWGFGPCVPI
jgi:hypothetical protein